MVRFGYRRKTSGPLWTEQCLKSWCNSDRLPEHNTNSAKSSLSLFCSCAYLLSTKFDIRHLLESASYWAQHSMLGAQQSSHVPTILFPPVFSSDICSDLESLLSVCVIVCFFPIRWAWLIQISSHSPSRPHPVSLSSSCTPQCPPPACPLISPCGRESP